MVQREKRRISKKLPVRTRFTPTGEKIPICSKSAFFQLGYLKPILMSMLLTAVWSEARASRWRTVVRIAASRSQYVGETLSLLYVITGQNGVHLVHEISSWSSQVLCIGLVKTNPLHGNPSFGIFEHMHDLRYTPIQFQIPILRLAIISIYRNEITHRIWSNSISNPIHPIQFS